MLGIINGVYDQLMAYKDYIFTHRNGREEKCKLVYSPILTDYKCNPYPEAMALIEFPMENGIDLRQVPLRTIKPI